jgi:CheY-like chemotaxis protein
MTERACQGLVMVVEDDRDVRESIAEVLEDHDYQPLGASNGKEAIERLRLGKDKPCVILLDMMMPVMDGQQFRAIQREDPELSSIPVVVLTAHANTQQAASGMAVAACLKKPVQLEVLLDAVHRFCKHGVS